jgi:RNA polymerase sigma factor (sigma-70 family)
MSDKIPDASIKESIRRFKEGNEQSRENIITVLSEYIYNYPRIVFGVTEDVAGDFFEYILIRLDRILEGYRETDAKFVTWFTVVLRNRYLNFVRTEQSRHAAEHLKQVVSLDYDFTENRNLYNILGDKRDYSSENSEGFDRLLDAVVRDLSARQRLLFHLYYLETLRPEDVGFISIYLGKTIRETLAGISALRYTLSHKYRVRNRCLQRLNVLYFQLIRSQGGNDCSAAEKVKKKRKKVLDEYRKVKLNPSYESISQFTGLPMGTISSGIQRMKNSVKRYFEEHRNGRM